MGKYVYNNMQKNRKIYHSRLSSSVKVASHFLIQVHTLVFINANLNNSIIKLAGIKCSICFGK